MNDLAKLDATAQAEWVRSKQIAPLELVDAAIGRIEKVNPRLNAVIIPLFEKARSQAKRGDIPDGPFRGVPLLIKDLILATAGDPLHLGTSVEQYINSVDWLHEWSRRMAQWWHGGFDLLLTPTLVQPPPKLGTLTPTAGDMAAVRRLVEMLQFTQPFNVTGQPAMSVPLAWSAARLPIGAQFVAAMGREDLLIRLASQLEQARPWKDRLPGIHADN